MNEMKNWTVEYQEHKHYSELPQEEVHLVQKALHAMNNAYAPYSKFKVGAVAMLDDGNIVSGSNQENKAYPSGLCAERVALFNVGANFPNKKVKKLVVVAEGDLVDESQVVGPCGACRQVMLETMERQNEAYEVLLLSQSGKVLRVQSPKDLLPFSF